MQAKVAFTGSDKLAYQTSLLPTSQKAGDTHKFAAGGVFEVSSGRNMFLSSRITSLTDLIAGLFEMTLEFFGIAQFMHVKGIPCHCCVCLSRPCFIMLWFSFRCRTELRMRLLASRLAMSSFGRRKICQVV